MQIRDFFYEWRKYKKIQSFQKKVKEKVSRKDYTFVCTDDKKIIWKEKKN